ncbi:MAG: PHP domain-containing protein [Acidimicrobiales bacterium]|nr:PHP domain-containing protein [Acidimicrobiales bacterium]
MRIDGHSHTMWSGDASTTPDELIAALPASGVDVLCITDHNSIEGARRFAETGELGIPVIVGEEVKTADGELIGLFLTERVPFGLKPAEAVNAIRQQGGVVYVPHPFDEMRHCMKPDALYGLARDGGLDVIETMNAKTSLASLNARADAFADEFGLRKAGGSDAHVPAAFGAAWTEVDDNADVSTAAGFLDALARPTTRVCGAFFDPPRPWTPRIVPSTKPVVR